MGPQERRVTATGLNDGQSLVARHDTSCPDEQSETRLLLVIDPLGGPEAD